MNFIGKSILIKLIPAEPCHINQIAPLIMITGYWACTLKYNNLDLSVHDFMCEYVVKPRLPFTIVAVDSSDHTVVLGVMISGTKQEMLNIPTFTTTLPAEITRLFDGPTHAEIVATGCYHISILAVSKQSRSQGLGKQLFEFAEARANYLGCKVLSLLAFSCQTNAIQFYLKMGMMITNTVHRSHHLPFPILLYLEKSNELTEKLNYFETNHCKNIHLLNK